MKWRWLAALILVAGLGLASLSRAEEALLPLPRFASLKSGTVNLRHGPGTQYPIDWVLVKRGLPVEIIRDYDEWRRIRDSQGSEGWVHASALTGRRSAVIINGAALLYAEPKMEQAAIAQLETGLIVRLLACQPDWCRIDADGKRGWLRRDAVWGILPGEVF